MTRALVSVETVSRAFTAGRAGAPWARRRTLIAVDGVSLALDEGEILGLVGESGCGKSTLGRLVLGLVRPTAGMVRYRGRPVEAAVGTAAWRALRREMQMVFQNPYGSLNPRLTIASQLREVLDVHGIGAATGREAHIVRMLEAVGLDATMLPRYAHQLSGGQLQRIVIARALSLSPRLLVLDEAVAALDVSVQAQIINLLHDLQQAHGLTYLFISHDLGLVRHLSDRVMVMYLGRIVETGSTSLLFSAPRHPYTQALLAAAPRIDPRSRGARLLLQGDPPSPFALPRGCRFSSRCPMAEARCGREVPPLRPLAADPTRLIACHAVEA